MSIAEAKESVNIVDEIGEHISLTKRGAEYYGICPFHDDSKASLQVNERKQVYKCFACGVGGDVIDFLTRITGKPVRDVVASLKFDAPTAQKKQDDNWVFCMPTEEPAFNIKHFSLGAPTKVYRYTTLMGQLMGFICRFNTTQGKQILPYTLHYNGQHYRWMWRGFPKPRPLYNQYVLPNNPEKAVLITEGEKTTEAAASIFPEYNCISWMGGSQAWQYADWTPLKEKFDVILWPDNDEPGVKAMAGIKEILEGYGCNVKTVRLDQRLPLHWDLADSTQPEKVRNYLSKNLI